MPKKQSNPSREVPWGYGYVQRRGNRWQARWPEEQADGTVKWPGQSFATEDAAYDHLRTLGRKRRDGTYVPPSERTVADLIETWLKRGKRRWSTNTYANYEDLANRHIVPELGKLRIVEVTTARLQDWMDALADQGYAAGTLQLIRVILGNAFSEAVDLEIVAKSPVRKLKMAPVVEGEPPAWTVDEVRRVLAIVDRSPLWSAVYRFALTTGCRPGEVMALQWKDVDLTRGTATIRRTLTRDERKRHIVGSKTKTKLIRRVEITPQTKRAIERWRGEQGRNRADAGDRWEEGDFVFTGAAGHFLHPQTWGRYQRALIEKAKVKPLNLHGLRHTNATLDIDSGAHIKVVQERLGHKHIEQTMKYMHASPVHHREAAGALDSRISGPKKGKSRT